jgi:SHO1 osmosensor
MPRGAFDPALVISAPVLLGSFVLAIPGWFTAFISQIVVESKFHGGRSAVGVGWFCASRDELAPCLLARELTSRTAIFLQLFLIAFVFWTLATSAIVENRVLVGVLSAVALVFTVIETDAWIYGSLISDSASRGIGAGNLLLCFVNVRASV